MQIKILFLLLLIPLNLASCMKNQIHSQRLSAIINNDHRFDQLDINKISIQYSHADRHLLFYGKFHPVIFHYPVAHSDSLDGTLLKRDMRGHWTVFIKESSPLNTPLKHERLFREYISAFYVKHIENIQKEL